MSLDKDLKAIKSQVNYQGTKFNDFLLENSYATISTAIPSATRLDQIVLASPGLKGKMLRYSKFALTFPDGSNPTVIELKVGFLNSGATTINIYADGQNDWEQIIFPAHDYPVGSLISGLDFQVNDVQAAAGSADATGGDVQYYSGGALAGSSSGPPTGSPYDFKFNPASGVVTAQGFAGDGSALTNLPATSPGGVTNSIQSKSSGGNFIGYSQFKFNIDQSGGNFYMNGRATFGDANNGATGIYAFAIGTNTNATSQDAFALGENALASGRQSIAGGYECLAQGSASFAIGALTSSYGERSASFGSNSDNFGEDSVVMGHNNGVATTSDRSLTLGYENTNNSSNSLLMGQSNTLLNLYAGGTSGGGTGCLVGGYNNSVQVNDGIVFGSDCDAGVTSAGSNNSKNQFLFGLGLGVPKNYAGDAAGQAQIVVGKYNENQNQIHTVFSVGTGADAANRKTSFVVESQGRVAVGKTAPNLLFEVNGSAGKPGGGSWSTISDERVKTNIRPYNKGLSDIIKLDPKIYDYNGKAAMPIDIKDNVGVIAQEIKDVFPDTVESYETKLNETDEDKVELLSFNPNELTYALINSVKELNAEVQALRKELNELKNK